jgi:hypothetical protein
VCIAAFLLSVAAHGQEPPPIRIMSLYWADPEVYDNAHFEPAVRAALQAGSERRVEYYSEYLDTNRFSNDKQVEVFRDYLRGKYAGRRIDVIIAQPQSLMFLLKYRAGLFPQTPILFIGAEAPSWERRAAPPGITGLVLSAKTAVRTLRLALKLHPDTRQVFVVSGTMTRGKQIEMLVRAALQDYRRAARINYLTDFEPSALTSKLASLPEGSASSTPARSRRIRRATFSPSRTICR